LNKISFWSHLIDLRNKLLISFLFFILFFVLTFIFYKDIVFLFISPFQGISSFNHSLFINNLFEGFFIKIKCSTISSFIACLPLNIYLLFCFIFPALSHKERKIIGLLLFPCFLLALSGAYICYFQLLPLSIPFLLSNNFIPEQIGILLNFQDSFLYVLKLLLFSLIAFQFPLIILLLLYFKIFSLQTLFRSFRFMVLIIFIFSAVITPPDIISQLFIALPIILLLIMVLLLAYIFKIGDFK